MTFTQSSLEKNAQNESIQVVTFIEKKSQKKEKPVQIQPEKDSKWNPMEWIEKLNASQLQGKELMKYNEEKFKKMGIKPKAGKAPLPILIGMNKKKKQRDDKERQLAKESGMLDLLKPKKKLFKKSKDKGLYGSVGTIKGGIMHVSKKAIQSIEKKSKKRK